MNWRTGGRQELDDIDDLDVLETFDWNEDPWDASLGVSEVEPVRTQTRTAKWLGYLALALANVLILAGGVYGWWYIRQANAPGDVGAPVAFTIADGESLQQISVRLEDEGIIQNAAFFRDYVGDHGGLEVTPGYYRLPAGDHVGNVLARLRTPPEETYLEITFPEGFTLRQIGTRLAQELPQFSVEAFMTAARDQTIPSAFRPAGVASMEGLLFPATYRVYNADSERQVIIRMAEQMERVGDQEDIRTVGPAGIGADYTPYQILTIASMIEREAKTEEDRPLIARVIYNRLAEAMPLEIDATAIYGAPAELLPPNVEELDIDTIVATPNPWNTYDFPGLPPTPIANPGRASIEAALHPAPNPSSGNALCQGLPAGTRCQYLFYVVADEQGNHAFAVTLEQHEANIKRADEAGLL